MSYDTNSTKKGNLVARKHYRFHVQIDLKTIKTFNKIAKQIVVRISFKWHFLDIFVFNITYFAVNYKHLNLYENVCRLLRCDMVIMLLYNYVNH